MRSLLSVRVDETFNTDHYPIISELKGVMGPKYDKVKENPTYCFKLINSKKKELNNYLNVNLVNLCFQYDLMYCMIT